MKKILIAGLFLIVINNVFAQDVKQLAINIKVENKNEWRELTAEVPNGSGDYIYVWMCSAPYGINSERSLKTAVIPMDDENITYEVFIRDQKSGIVGHSSINFSTPSKVEGVRVFPNPAQDIINVSLADEKSDDGNILKVDLYGEKTSEIIKSIPITESKTKEVKIDIKGIASGIYYVHVFINGSKTGEAERKVIRVLIGGQ